MEGQKRSWPLKEMLVVVVVIAILVLIGYAINLDHKKKSRTSEVTGSLKEITIMQLAFRENPYSGYERYASRIGTIGWQTGLGSYGNEPADCNWQKNKSLQISGKSDYSWACGKYFAYGASEKNNCSDETTGQLGVGQALAYAAPAMDAGTYPDDWQTGACAQLKEETTVQEIFLSGNGQFPLFFKNNFELHHK